MKNRSEIRSFSGQPSQRTPQNQRLEIKCGHNGQQVVVVFTLPVQNVILTEVEVESHITALQDSLAALRKHKAES